MSEQNGSDPVAAADSRVALDPGTPPEVLAQIAQARPELRVFVAMNPATYPGLVEWLATLGDPAVNAALATRAAAPATPLPGPPVPPPVAPGLPSTIATAAPTAEATPLPAEITPAPVSRPRRPGLVVAMVLAGVLVLAGGGFLAHRLAAGSSRAPASVVTATIHVGKSPAGVAVDGSAHTAYVANGDDGTVSVIDTRSNTVTATIPVGRHPADPVLDGAAHTAYVTNGLDGTVSAIDTRTNTVTSTITVGMNLRGVAVDPTTGSVFVANASDDTVSVLTAR